MKTTFTLLFCFIAITIYAQPKISDSWVPEIGDVWKTSVTLDTPGPGESGADVTWDYSDLNVQGFQFQIVFDWVDPAATPYVDSFPDATVCASFQGFGYGYYSNSESGFDYLGSGNQFGFDIFANPQRFNFIGMEYEETVVDSYELVRYTSFTSPKMPVGESSYTYDAYGTLILPDATISDAIRIFEIDVETDSIDQFGSATVNVDSLVSYAWIAEGSVFPVALWQISTSYSRIYIAGELINEEVDGPDTTFSINPDYVTTSVLANHIDLPKLDVFPTITRDEVNVKVDEYSPLKYSMHSLNGSMVDGGYLNGDISTINISALQPGYYVIKVDGYAPELFVKME